MIPPYPYDTPEYRKWFAGLTDDHQAKVDVYIDRMLEGNTGNTKRVESHILKIVVDTEIRVYFTKRDGILRLLYGGFESDSARDIPKVRRILENL